MQKLTMTFLAAALGASTSAQAINARYRQQLERSGCTQVSETEGCDIHKSREENAKAGFVSAAPATATPTPYAGSWVAKSANGARLATIHIDRKEHVSVNGKKVSARRSDGALLFRVGKITYLIQGDRRLQGEDYWLDPASGTKGPISAD